MKFELPRLPYEPDILEPLISKRTLEFHHGKHLQLYVTNLNNLTAGTNYENTDLETIIKVASGPVFNNASQVWNHIFYFEGLSPVNGNSLKSPFSKIIIRHFGSVHFFKDSFFKAASSLFGSGWVWLVWNPKGTMEILQEYNAGNPLRKGLVPLLACDVWEHSYYLDYQHRRADYLVAFWSLINWEVVEKRYKEARK
jgi:superoxide dismutase, Fe-Mn family